MLRGGTFGTVVCVEAQCLWQKPGDIRETDGEDAFAVTARYHSAEVPERAARPGGHIPAFSLDHSGGIHPDNVPVPKVLERQ
jgi:hypothetical protein